MITYNGAKVKPTIFPDGTSQVWNIDLVNSADIVWHYENEQELIWLYQLLELVLMQEKYVEVYIPYLPYARQDKQVHNDASFAGNALIPLLTSFSFPIHTLDVHNNVFDGVTNHKPFVPNWHDCVVFPDAGAEVRYGETFATKPTAVGRKVRDQATGWIKSYELVTDVDIYGRVLVVDDLCDGGATFNILAESLKEHKDIDEVDLWVTHGVFSKGLSELADNYGHVHTTDSYFPNFGENALTDKDRAVQFEGARDTGFLKVYSAMDMINETKNW